MLLLYFLGMPAKKSRYVEDVEDGFGSESCELRQ